MIHQEILAVPELTVAQNIFLGRETNNGLFGWLNDRDLTKRAGELLEQMGVHIKPTLKMKHLSVAGRQLVDIAKAISTDASVIIMDEPTSALSSNEVDTLFRIIRDLTQKGVAIIYTSHKLEEVFALADTITVLRDGQYITTKPAAELDANTLITLMVGREINTLFPANVSPKGDVVLSVKQLSSRGKFSDITFDVHAGEVLGIAGLMGAGRTEIARAIFGLDRLSSGDIHIKGRKIVIRSPNDALRHGIGYVSEDRKKWGFIPRLSVRHNITLSSLPRYKKGLFIQPKRETETATAMMADLHLKAASLNQPVVFLSGGNQQKVVIGNMLLSQPALLILDEPTRGIDVGAKAEIYKLINQLTAQGIAILMISSELPELIGLSDRVLVLAKGRQTALLSRTDASQETIMRYAMQP